MQKIREFKFQKLTPTDDVNMEGYEQSLDYVFDPSNTDIKNVALTGVYGSGKSSVMLTYEKDHPEKKFLHVTLAHINGADGEDDENNYAVRIEEKIINQLIQQIDPKNVPESGFKLTRTIGFWVKAWWTFRILVLIASFWYFSSWDILHKSKGNSIGEWMTSYGVTVAIVVMTLLDVGLLIYSFISLFITKKKIKTISFANGSIDFDDNEDNKKSYFDQHLDEILYLLVHSKADAIVFEDIDRFKDVDLKVLEHLRELCTLANNRLSCTDKQQSILRFFYLISDDIFLQNKERTKFFDYMLPIIPVVDASNSYSKFKEYLQASSDYDEINDRFLRGLSLFIDDLRTVKNIVNEYQIYSSKLVSTISKPNCLLALIAYKNILPKDFSELQLKRGAIYTILESKDKLAALCQESINSEIKELEEKLEMVRKEHLYSVQELDLIKADRYTNKYNKKYQDCTYEEWYNNVYSKRFEVLNIKEKDSERKLNNQITELRKKLSYINNKHLSELITSDNEDDVFGIIKLDNKIKDCREKEKNEELVKNKNFIVFLIRNGYIDETIYRDCMTLFYENGISLKDKEFLIGINTHEGKEFNYKLDSIEQVIQNLTPDDFLQVESRNHGLIDYILKNNMKSCIEKFVFQLQEKYDYEYISKYFRVTSYKGLFVRALCEFWDEAVISMISIENQAMSLMEIQEFVICCLANIGIDAISKQNIDNRLTAYIEDEFKNAECSADECMAVRAGLAVLKIKMQNLDTQISKSSKLRNVLYEFDMYFLNKENIYSILKNEFSLSEDDVCGRELSAIYSDENQPLYKYVKNNLNDVIINVVLSNEKITDDREVVLKIIEDETVDEELKDKYLYKFKNGFESLDDINPTQWNRVLMNDSVEHTADVILKYYKLFGYNSILVNFINDSVNPIEYKDVVRDGEDIINLFKKENYNGNGLDETHYKEMVDQLLAVITPFEKCPNVDEFKLRILLEQGLITMTTENLKSIRQNYPQLIVKYIESDVDGYLGIINSENNRESEILQAIESRRISNEDKKELLFWVSSPISIENKEYDEEIIEYILEKNFDVDELPYYIENYNLFSKNAKEYIYTSVNNHMDILKNNIAVLSRQKDLLFRIYDDPNVALKIKLVVLDFLAENNCLDDLAVILHKMNLDNLTKLVSGDTSRLPKIKNGENENAVLNVLEKHGFIAGFEIDEATNTLKVERK